MAVGPVGGLASAGPLSRPPPAGGEHGLLGLGQVKRHPDAVGETFWCTGHVGVAPALPDDAVNALAAGFPEPDPIRLERIVEPVDRDACGVRPQRLLRSVREALVVDQQEPICDLHLVRVGIGGRVPLRHQLGTIRSGYVEDRRARSGRARVSDVERVAVTHDLHAVASSAQVVLAEESKPSCRRGFRRHWAMSPGAGRSGRPSAFCARHSGTRSTYSCQLVPGGITFSSICSLTN